jgi:membrane protease subunit HflC
MKYPFLKTVAGVVLAIVVFAGGITLMSAAYFVDQAEQVVILQFGKPVGKPISEPGIHFKVPFIQDVLRYDKRLIAWDGAPNQIPTRGREFISIDTTARWRIVDPLQFLKSVRDEKGAQSRLDDIIDSTVRDKISSTELTEIVRSKDWEVTVEDLKRVRGVQPDADESSLTERIRVGRNTLTRAILEQASKGMPARYGIELVDVRIKRLNYITTVREQVFQRMVSERQRVAEQFRSEGQGEASRIRGETSRQLATIRSEAKRKAEGIRGEADAEATRVYNEAYTADTEFYALLRTLESYEKTLGKQTVLLLSSQSDYFKVLRNMAP